MDGEKHTQKNTHTNTVGSSGHIMNLTHWEGPLSPSGQGEAP